MRHPIEPIDPEFERARARYLAMLKDAEQYPASHRILSTAWSELTEHGPKIVKAFLCGLGLMAVVALALHKGWAAEQTKPTGASHAQVQEVIQYGPWLGYWQQARLSAYSPHDALDREYHESKGERWRWICADGRTDVRAEPYGIAATSSVPFGTRIFVPTGHGYLDSSRVSLPSRVFVVSDRGSALERGSERADGCIRLDLRYRTEFSALAFGVKDAWVFIITGDAK